MRGGPLATGRRAISLEEWCKMSRARRRPWLTVLVGAALALAVVIRTQVPATSIHAVGDPVIVAAGDIACGTASTGSCSQNSTESAIATVNPDAVLTLGDEQYECGDLSDWSFSKGYGPSWGTQKAITHPATGNHEYKTSTDSSSPCFNRPAGAPGYYSYFGSAASPLDSNCTSNCKGYYSFDLGAWHLIALNAQCAYVSCAAGSDQEQWLKADLAAHPNTCVLAYWHQSRWSSGDGNLATYSAFWQDLYAAGADVVLSAHDHDYERFAPQDPSENLDLAHGIREFVVGTGGRELSSFQHLQPNSELRQSGTFGVLKLTLHASSYDWQFIRTAGQPMPNGDSGTASCSTASVPLFTPVADSYVDSTHPISNFGTMATLNVDASPIQESYLKFQLSGLTGKTVTSAKLRIYVTDNGSVNGGSVAKMSDTSWGETTVTYNNRPAIDGTTLSSLGAVSIGRWYELDVTPAVTGDGTLSLGIKTSSTDGVHYASREDSTHAPQLVVTVTS
jgi:hypothetical protein